MEFAARLWGMEFAAMKRRDLLELCRQHGLATRGSKADLAASLAGALSVAAASTAENVVQVVVGKGCLKLLGGSASTGTSGAAKKVRFALDEEWEERARSRRSLVILQPVVTKTRGRRKARKVHCAAAVSRRGQRWKRDDVGGDYADEDVTGEVCADTPVMWPMMKGVCLCVHNGAESQNNPAEAEKEGEVVEAAIGRKQKRKQKTEEKAEVIADNSHVGISRGNTRSSSSLSAEVLVSPFLEKKRRREEARDGKVELGAEEQPAEVKGLTTAASPVIMKSRSTSHENNCAPSAQEPPKVAILPTDIGNKCLQTRSRPKAKGALPETVVSGRVSWQKSDASGVSVHHDAFGLSTRRHQQLASSAKEEQVAAPCELPPLKRSMRNHPEADELLSNANLETNKLFRLPVESNDLKIVHPSTLNTANASVEDVVAKADKEVGFTKGSSKDKEARNAGVVSFSGDNGNKTSAAKTELGVLDERTTFMHETFSGEVFQCAKGGDVGKPPAVRGPVRRSTRRCVVAGRI